MPTFLSLDPIANFFPKRRDDHVRTPENVILPSGDHFAQQTARLVRCNSTICGFQGPFSPSNDHTYAL